MKNKLKNFYRRLENIKVAKQLNRLRGLGCGVLIVILLCITQLSNAQTNISNITPITEAEFLTLQNSKEGDMVLIKNTGIIYYFSGGQWFAIQGECYPKPASPQIDSIKIKDNQVFIYFDDSKKNFQSYLIKNLANEQDVSVKSSPAILAAPLQKGKNTYTILGENKCGKAGPVSYQDVEY
jgi:hypothetical protein